ncbi:hypothetical protein LCGC14_2045450 [marine sediment metagenome]|uniref:DNA primase DNAG catalytic core N-terminal domain-containing protein n=1 Tax=marine sediment metagenome TaxID=412755 RepID=A0A0F9H404_9ZZZZ
MAIGLGGRAMDPNARAKYLNSPETPLFDKGRSLYNHGPAREAAGKQGPLIVAEAGGRVTDRHGAPQRFNSAGRMTEGMLAAPAPLHEALRRELV